MTDKGTYPKENQRRLERLLTVSQIIKYEYELGITRQGSPYMVLFWATP